MFQTRIVSTAALAVMAFASWCAWGCSSADDDKTGGTTDTDAGAGTDAATQPAPAPPLSAPPGQWTWLDVPESECANGAPTGLGFNIGTSKDLVIFLEGGGACWNESLCLDLKTASYIDGYQRPEWETALTKEISDLGDGGLFDRKAANNPYKDSSFVYIPYCTADVHAGDATQEFSSRTMHYSGRKNIEAFLAKIVPSFPEPTRVTMAGRSAGGFGAAINYWRAKRAFGDVRIDLLDDSGPPFEQSTITTYPTWAETWNLAGALPPECAECQTNVRLALPYYSRTNPNSRFALLSYDKDSVISQFYLQSADQFQANLKDLTENTIAPLPNAKYFVISGTKHTMTSELSVTSEDKTLADWVNDFGSDSPAWSSVSPL